MFRVVTASWDKTERVWDIASDQSSTPLRVTKRKKAYVKKRVPNGGHVLTYTYDSSEIPFYLERPDENHLETNDRCFDEGS